MGEPSLSCGPSKPQAVYRFTWLRTFHHPIAIRIAPTTDGAQVDAVELDGAGGYKPGKVIWRQTRGITSAQLRRVQKEMVKLWAMPPDDAEGLDGAEWIFEDRTADLYRLRSIWSPETGPARTAGELFLEVSGINVPPSERYYS